MYLRTNDGASMLRNQRKACDSFRYKTRSDLFVKRSHFRCIVLKLTRNKSSTDRESFAARSLWSSESFVITLNINRSRRKNVRPLLVGKARGFRRRTLELFFDGLFGRPFQKTQAFRLFFPQEVSRRANPCL